CLLSISLKARLTVARRQPKLSTKPCCDAKAGLRILRTLKRSCGVVRLASLDCRACLRQLDDTEQKPQILEDKCWHRPSNGFLSFPGLSPPGPVWPRFFFLICFYD